jgi:hypothetical protein
MLLKLHLIQIYVFPNKIPSHIVPDSINPWFLRIYRVPKPTIEESEILPRKPDPHTQAPLNRTDLATDLVADNFWITTNGIPSRKKARPTRHHHIT